MKQATKEYQSWDESYLFDFIEIVLHDWVRYYEAKDCVVGAETYKGDKTRSTRLEIVSHMITLFEEMNDADLYDMEEYDKKTKKFFRYFAANIHYMWD